MLYSIVKRRGLKSRLIVISLVVFVFIWVQYSGNSTQSLDQTTINYLDLASSNTEKNNENLEEKIDKLNRELKINNFYLIEQIIKNEQHVSSKSSNHSNLKFPPPAPKFIVILVQVHSRLNYLKELINSLRQTRHINETLVVFSHDFFDNEINKLIESIDFCATLQIFYPFSLQIFPNKFPGQDPNDCPKSIKKEEAKIRKCNNADSPDTFGHYREATIVQIKHHWFWKLNFVFDKLDITKYLNNLNVLLLEEDHYVFQDSIHIIRKLTQKILSDVDIVSLGYFKGKNQLFEPKTLKFWSKSYWWASSNGIGLVVSRMLFDKIKSCSKMFCEYDDYNWDWSLQYLVQKCLKDHLISIYPTFSRVAHLGECGTHFKSKACDPSVKLSQMNKKYHNSVSNFFPESISMSGKVIGVRKIKKSNGGWSDPRDHELCKSFVTN